MGPETSRLYRLPQRRSTPAGGTRQRWTGRLLRQAIRVPVPRRGGGWRWPVGPRGSRLDENESARRHRRNAARTSRLADVAEEIASPLLGRNARACAPPISAADAVPPDDRVDQTLARAGIATAHAGCAVALPDFCISRNAAMSRAVSESCEMDDFHQSRDGLGIGRARVVDVVECGSGR